MEQAAEKGDSDCLEGVGWKKKGKHQKRCGRALLALTECHKVSVHMDREQCSHISNTYSNMHKQK